MTTRAHVHLLATDHGIADLLGKNLRQRAARLIAIAHPRHREALQAEASRRFGTWQAARSLGAQHGPGGGPGLGC